MPWWEKALCLVLIGWFVVQLFIFESISGYAAFLGIIVASLAYLYFHHVKSKGWRVAGAIIIVALPVLAAFLFYRTLAPMMLATPVDLTTLEKKTAQGNDYWHDTVHFPLEDGQFTGLYLCQKELQESWSQRSRFDYKGLTTNGENLEATLVRYMTSKGLRKDAEGMAALNDQDIRNVEQGIAN